MYEVIEDTDESDDDASDKIYVIMELANLKEVMTWNENTYKFQPNIVFGSEYIREEYIYGILKDMASALHYLHQCDAQLVRWCQHS